MRALLTRPPLSVLIHQTPSFPALPGQEVLVQVIATSFSPASPPALKVDGQTVTLDHGAGVFSQLAHLSRIDVREGEMVQAGQVVGLVGATGRVTGAHLHWGVRVSGARVDALSLLAVLGPAKPAA